MPGLLFAAASFVAVHAVFAYFVFFLANLFFDRTVSRGGTAEPLEAALTDIALIVLFGLQHSVMARAGVKSVIARLVPEGLQRAVYVAAAVITLFLLTHLFQPIPYVVWQVEAAMPVVAIWVVFVLGWTISAAGYLSMGFLHLLGVDQALAWYRGRPVPAPSLQQGWIYRVVRNPQQLGLLLALWATPDMTVGHLLLAAGLSGYIFLGTYLEGRDLLADHDADYRRYRGQVPGFLPRIRRRRD
ncbi:MAG: isoprenylcysteine carboxylmethyltransferase family protein [Hyphomicrobiales bacterium]|nr:isoprenylcysteine carboxylmethyltransferase family protein [Hyphomicrobiales bacterium]